MHPTGRSRLNRDPTHFSNNRHPRAQYARDSVPRQFWTSPTFKATNRRLTTMWAWLFTAMVPFHVLAGVIDKKPTNILFNWVIPIGLIIWGAKRSDEIAASAKSSA